MARRRKARLITDRQVALARLDRLSPGGLAGTVRAGTYRAGPRSGRSAGPRTPSALRHADEPCSTPGREAPVLVVRPRW